MKVYKRRLRQLKKRLEKERLERAKRGCSVGLVWTEDEQTLPTSTEGARAVDLYVCTDEESLFPRSRTVERLARGPGDVGDVFDIETGRKIGVIVKSEKGLITWDDLKAEGA